MADHDEHQEEHSGGHGGGHGAHAGGGGHAEGEHEGAPEWLISFADNVALLMGFFVILLAMNMKAPTVGGIGGIDGPSSPQPSRQWLDLVIAIREAFHSPINMDSNDPSEAPLRRRLREREEEDHGASIIPGPDGGETNPQSIEPSGWIDRTAVIPFEFGLDALSDEARDTARKAAHTVAGNLNLIVEVRGNVSAQEARRNTERAWDLSYRRAQAVAQVLIGEGMPASHLRLVACGDGNPLKLRADTPGDSRTNQRVELVIIKERPKTDEFSDQGDDAPKTNK